MKKVLVFGAFDVIHPGHIDFLKQAREHGDYLVASIARDSYVKQWKGKTPIHPEEERRRHVLDTGLVDDAILGDEVPGTYSLVRSERPDVVCLGYDQELFKRDITAWLSMYFPDTKVVSLKAYRPETYKSSKLNAEAYRNVKEESSEPK